MWNHIPPLPPNLHRNPLTLPPSTFPQMFCLRIHLSPTTYPHPNPHYPRSRFCIPLTLTLSFLTIISRPHLFSLVFWIILFPILPTLCIKTVCKLYHIKNNSLWINLPRRQSKKKLCYMQGPWKNPSLLILAK